MTADRAYDAVLVVGFGGPESPDEVMPFLRRVTAGRGVPEERLAEVGAHYRTLGGISPINAQTRHIRDSLEAALGDRGIRLPVLLGNRNTEPFLPAVVEQARRAGHRRILAVTTSAYSSYSSCRQYRENLAAALIESGSAGKLTIDKVRPYFDTPGFLEPFADGLARAAREALSRRLAVEELRLLFVTHSIPLAMSEASGSALLGDHGDSGGAYVAQHEAVAASVIERAADLLPEVAEIDHQLVYQSRSGSPQVPWLEPDINDVLPELAAAGVRGVIVVPIGFVSDHVEVIWDLDHEAAETAADHALGFWRVPTPSTDPRFASSLADLVAERLGRGLSGEAGTRLTSRPDQCPAGCCVNARRRLPTIAADDSADDWADDWADERAAAGATTEGSTAS